MVSSNEFINNQEKYFDLALNEQVFVQKGDNMFLVSIASNETKKYKKPDVDFYRAITMGEFKLRAREVVEKAYKKYTNECNNTTGSAELS